LAVKNYITVWYNTKIYNLFLPISVCLTFVEFDANINKVKISALAHNLLILIFSRANANLRKVEDL